MSKQKGLKLSKSMKILIITAAVAVVLVGVLLLLIFWPSDSEPVEFYEETEMSLSVDDNGVHTAAVVTNDKGEIEKNSGGTLIEYVPSQISLIEIENQSGSYAISSYTPTTEGVNSETGETESQTDHTIYKLVGYEDFELQTSIPDEIATDAAAMTFTKVVELNSDNLADYGLSKPRATVKVSYTDNTYAMYYVGNDAPSAAGTYVKFGSNSTTVYLVDSESVNGFLINTLDLFDLAINDSATSEDNTTASKITLSGTAYPDKIVLKPNEDKEIAASYVIASSGNAYASEAEVALVTGTIRGLYAQSVVCVNPSADQLSQYGLSKPYAAVEASYPDTTVKLFTSAPQDDNTVYITDSSKKLIYKIALSSVAWADTSLEKLTSELLFTPYYDYLSSITVSYGGEDYKFSITTGTEQQEDADGNIEDVEVSVVKYGSKKIDATNFRVFYQNVTALANLGATSASSSSADLVVTYSYNSSRSDDTLAFYNTGDSKIPVALNGEIIGLTYANSITKIEGNVEDLIAGKTVANFS